MKRTYDNNEQRDDVLTFTGIEVERTPCYGLKTYFVVGVPREDPVVFVNKVMKQECEQIYFGANHSLKNWKDEWTGPMTALIRECLSAKFWVTLDVDGTKLPESLTSFLGHKYFSVTYSIQVPNIDKVNGNINIKIDDVDFEATNKGVWSTTLRSIKVKNNFTPWDDYKKDTII